MFELKILKQHPLVYVAEQSNLLIGSSLEPPVDLTINDAQLHEIHLQIHWEQGAYYIINLAHDPSTRLNQAPFFKKRLRSEDLISIGTLDILFTQKGEGTEERSHANLQSPSFKKSQDLLGAQAPTPQETPAVKNVVKPQVKPAFPLPAEGKWNLWVFFLSLVVLFVILFSTSIYITIQEKIEKHRFYAARGLADIAMSLKYAQLHQVEPNMKNWLDPSFLETLGSKIIAKELTDFQWISKEGNFLHAPYLLRIYSSQDGSRFLLMAQPQASLLQWLIPKATLVVDSSTMTMKEFWHLRELNRLLVNSSSLDKASQKELEHLLSQGQPVSLNALSKERERLGYNPPEELSLFHPEAEYFLYNAPRYYLWNQEIFTKTLEIEQQHRSLESLEKALTPLKEFTHLVLYTPNGIETALLSRKILATLESPHVQLGYLELTTDQRIKESHLLLLNSKPYQQDLYPTASLHTEKDAPPKEALHPLYADLSLLQQKRKELLEPELEALNALLQASLQQNDPLFFYHFKTKFQTYQKALEVAQKQMDLSIEALYQQYVIKEKSLSFPYFTIILEKQGIELGLIPPTHLQKETLKLKELLELVRAADSLEELDLATALAYDHIQLEPVADTKLFEARKKQLKLLCLFKLESLLWAPCYHCAKGELKWIVSRILKNGYVHDLEGREFYLSQLEHHTCLEESAGHNPAKSIVELE